ncbi:MAG: helicase-related protein, partial [Pseudomonadota bacterium]|nr:helicase-related protein [Pseudomonadota bacterium]MEC8712378.1 helicase-related protein [Pseudomonadota bacterium]
MQKGGREAERRITVILGPTNTGKTHLALERMTGYASGMIGFPLRLLARENYDRLVARLGPSKVGLITGEERILPPGARYLCCTVESMPNGGGQREDGTPQRFDFVAVDEVQLAGDRERGHVFTDRILHARGIHETMFMGAETAAPLLRKMLPDARFETRQRMSVLSFAGSKKLTRLPRRSAIVAFGAAEVYQIAELVRRQRGGAAVVMGRLSPRTRNAQVELYQNGDVDFLVATDAIGMGLNLDLNHVALASDMKFDGRKMRRLTPAERAQIAGRAGRHTNDGTFGVTDGCELPEPEIVEAIEQHRFEPIR